MSVPACQPHVLVSHTFGDPAHQSIVVDPVKGFLRIKTYNRAVSLRNVLLRLGHRTSEEAHPMQQQTFAGLPSNSIASPPAASGFWRKGTESSQWTDLTPVIKPVYPTAEGPRRPPIGIEPWCACIVCNSSSTCRIRTWKRRSTTRAPCGSWWGLIWAASPYPMG